jgi:hypothetical protein
VDYKDPKRERHLKEKNIEFYLNVHNNTPERIGPGLYNGFVALIRYAEMKGDNEFYYVYSPINVDSDWTPEVKEDEEKQDEQ